MRLNLLSLFRPDRNAFARDPHLDVNGTTANLAVIHEILLFPLGRVDEESEMLPAVRALDASFVEHGPLILGADSLKIKE